MKAQDANVLHRNKAAILASVVSLCGGITLSFSETSSLVVPVFLVGTVLLVTGILAMALALVRQDSVELFSVATTVLTFPLVAMLLPEQSWSALQERWGRLEAVGPVITASAILWGVYFAYKRLSVVETQAAIAEDGQRVGRFLTAIEMLEHKKHTGSDRFDSYSGKYRQA